MFSRIQLLADSPAISHRFAAALDPNLADFLPNPEISGFDHAVHPVITLDESNLTCKGSRWGLIPPDWNKNPEDIHNFTITAKLEYIARRYSWQKVSANRCLIPATAYFEYHWNDINGKSKTKYIIRSVDSEIFALAGLFSIWRNPQGNLMHTFATCTTRANEIMAFVHNKDAARNYHRMPVMLNRDDEKNWLDASVPYMDFAYPNYHPNLYAQPLHNQPPAQQTLF